MKEIDILFKRLRVNLRKYGIAIAQDVFTRYHPATINRGAEVCIFCRSSEKITREHVFPKWLFERDTVSTFVSSVNRHTQTFNKATVPTCAFCNNTILAKIERHIIGIVGKMKEFRVEGDHEMHDLVRWLELIDYKAQVYDSRRLYIKHQHADEYDPVLGSLPLSMMRHFPDLNPFKARELLRRAQRRITVKSKSERLYSLAVFVTEKPRFYCFTQPDEYIYISFPNCRLSVFYFLQQRFDNNSDAMELAKYYIEGVRTS